MDGCESHRCKQYKLDTQKKKINMERKYCDSEPSSIGNSAVGGVEQGHDWNEQFDFKIERPAKVEYE